LNTKAVILISLALAGVLAGCSSKPPAPVVDRGRTSGSYQLTPDGHYRVRSGDTLHGISFHYGLDWQNIARWNGIRSPYLIYPDQLLRLSPPAGSSDVAVATHSEKSSTTGTTVTTGRRQPESRTVAAPSSSQAEQKPNAATKNADKPPASHSTGDPDQWLWPTSGRIVSNFKADDPARKGIDIAGTAGQAVIASAPGQVVYSGSGLIGYGELIIIKHSDRMLSAYAHNKRRLVSEGQAISAAQIAEMGKNDRNKALLHFEIRMNGKPVDPQKYLPRRP
jgi:lipoprotein NlpD